MSDELALSLKPPIETTEAEDVSLSKQRGGDPMRYDYEMPPSLVEASRFSGFELEASVSRVRPIRQHSSGATVYT